MTKNLYKVAAGRLAGMSLTEIGKYAYPKTKYPKTMAKQALRKPAVQNTITEALKGQKVTPDRVAKVISEGLDATHTDFDGNKNPDHVIRHKFADMSLKVLGGYAPEKTFHAHAHKHDLTSEMLEDLDKGKI